MEKKVSSFATTCLLTDLLSILKRRFDAGVQKGGNQEPSRTKSKETVMNDVNDENLARSPLEQEAKSRGKKFRTKHMRQFPELYRSDVSIHPSYTKLTNLPYQVVCRQRLQRISKEITLQLNREIMHFAMMQLFALDSIRIDRIFSVGMPPKIMVVPDFATERERRRIDEILRYT